MRFVSIKMQMGASKKLNIEHKGIPPGCPLFKNKYNLAAHPTLLFPNPNEQLLSKSMGGLGVEDFIKLSTTALDPKKDHYKLLHNFNKGKRDITEMIYLAQTAPTSLAGPARSETIAGSCIFRRKKG